jgi:transposase-like protein
MRRHDFFRRLEQLKCEAQERHCQVVKSVTSDNAMKKSKSLYHGYRFPAEVISCAVRWYFRFQLSLRDIEELLFKRGVIVTYETTQCWCEKFGKDFADRVKAVRRKRTARGTLTKCSLHCVANRTCYGVRLT